jgi:hypothetical protein
MARSHKKSILPLSNRSIPIDSDTTFLAHYDIHQESIQGIRPMGSYYDDEGLVLYYDFSKEQPMAYDLSGKDNHGVFYNCAWGNGINGKALDLNGTNSYIQLPTTLNDLGQGTKSFTVEAWIYLDANSAEALLCKNTWGGGNSLLTGVWSTKMNLDINTAYTYGVVNTGAWTHFVMSIDTTTAHFYSNATELWTGTIVSRSNWDNRPFQIGFEYDSPTAQTDFFDGKIVMIAAYDRALSAEEVTNHYNKAIYTPSYDGKFGKAVRIDMGVINNYVYDPISNVDPWRGTVGIDPSMTFRNRKVFYNTASSTGGGWRHICSNGTLELAPNEYATASIWLNKGTANVMPYWYMQGYIYDGTTWIHKDPCDGYTSRTSIYLNEMGKLFQDLYLLDGTNRLLSLKTVI